MNYPGAQFDQAWQAALAPEGYTNPTPKKRYHLVVIGAGPAGLIAAIGAAGLGANVALVERHRMGGDCLNVGCVPSKALLSVTDRKPDVSFADAFAWLREVRAGIAPHDSVARYSELGVDVFLGDAKLVGKQQVAVGDVTLTGRRVAICTGARAALPPIPGLADAAPLSNETVFDLTEQPRSIAILGAGPIGCELSMVFARLGTEVHLFELADRVLPLEIEAAGSLVAAELEALGVKLHLGAGVESVERGERVTVSAAGAHETVDEVLVALGRRPNTDGLNLDAAGIELDQRGLIKVDKRLKTSNPAVFAAGDCASPQQFTHHADAQARVVVQNALFAPTASVAGLVVPRCTYTTPEVASVGDTPLTLAADTFDTYRFEFGELDRGRAEGDTSSFAEVYTDKGGDRILGATIVGHDAGEQLSPVVLMMTQSLGLGRAASLVLPYPTRSEYLKRLGDAYNRTRLTPFVANLFNRWLKATA